VQFSQRQLRNTLGISVETFRHWKRVLPPFADRKKYTPRFSVGDLLAAGILQRLTDECGIQPRYLPEIARVIVEICNANAWATFEDKSLMVDIPEGTCRLVADTRDHSIPNIVVVCPLNPVMATIRAELARIQPSRAQREFLFSPTAVGDSRARRRRA
jgi:hypothetical protein